MNQNLLGPRAHAPSKQTLVQIHTPPDYFYNTGAFMLQFALINTLQWDLVDGDVFGTWKMEEIFSAIFCWFGGQGSSRSILFLIVLDPGVSGRSGDVGCLRLFPTLDVA